MWRFISEASARWAWHHYDRAGLLLASSTDRFAGRVDCVADAMRHGYMHPRYVALCRSRIVKRESTGLPPVKQQQLEHRGRLPQVS